MSELPVVPLPLETKSERAADFVLMPDRSGVTLSQRFEAIVRERPDAVALSFRGRTMTYAELNRRVDGLAEKLRHAGVMPEVRVGLALGRSPAFVIAMLATIKAGGAYVPLDPDYPAERLRTMLEDAQPRVLIVSSNKQGKVWDAIPAMRLLIDDDWAQDLPSLENGFVSDGSSSSAAYVMYTSGSTGVPNGVVVEQRSILRLVCEPNYMFIEPQDVFLQLAPVSFDASTFEVWGALLNGAKLILAEPGISDLSAIADTVRAGGSTVLWLTAGLFHAMVDEQLASLASVRVLLAGGDVVSPRHVERFLDAYRDAVFINGYGPTEGTTFTCCHSVRFGDALGDSVPIGRPISRTEVYLLDPQGKPVSAGEEGELYIGGEGVARGYLNRPDLTSARFVMDALRPGEMLYRSGDIVRMLPNGEIDFLGRRDEQVKIRGFRIEPREIESALLEHPAVRQAAVVATAEEHGKTLHAFWIGQADAPQNADLTSHLKNRLPAYMVPASIMRLDALPLTENGKVDRRRLVAMVAEQPAVMHYVPPSDLLELQLIEIWEEVLGVSRLGVRDEFFELGGHSLLAARMFAQLRSRLDEAIPLATLYQASTIEKLAAVIRKKDWEQHWSSLVPIREKGSRTPIFLIHGLRGNVLTYYGLRYHLSPEQPIYGLQAQGLSTDHGAFFSLEEVASQYVALMRKVQPHGPYLIGGFSAGGLIAFEMAQQLHQAGEPVSLLALFDSSVDVVGGHWVSSFYSLHALRRTFRMIWHHYRTEIRVEGVRGFFKARAIHLWRDVRIALWLGAQKLASFLGRKNGMMPQYLSVAEAAMLALRKYRPKPYAGSAILFRAYGSDFENPDPSNGFRRYIRGTLRIEDIDCGHADIFREPNIRILSSSLQQVIDQAHQNETQAFVG